jgi:hypothetical protein
MWYLAGEPSRVPAALACRPRPEGCGEYKPPQEKERSGLVCVADQLIDKGAIITGMPRGDVEVF